MSYLEEALSRQVQENRRLKRRLEEMRRELKRAKLAKPLLEIPVEIPAELKFVAEQLQEFRMLDIPPCIYFLMLAGRVVYVGQSSTLQTRLLEHLDRKLFDRVIYLPVKERWHLNELEAAFIRILRPELNRNEGVRISNPEEVLRLRGILTDNQGDNGREEASGAEERGGGVSG